MIKIALFFGWSIALFSLGSIAGWNGHQKVSELQNNPWSIVHFVEVFK